MWYDALMENNQSAKHPVLITKLNELDWLNEVIAETCKEDRDD